MAQHVVKQGLVLRAVLPHAAEEVLQRDAEALLDAPRGAVSLQTAASAAGAGQAARLDADVAELAAAGVVARAERAVHQYGAAHALLQREIGHAAAAAAHEILRVPAGRAVVFHMHRVGEAADQSVQRQIAQPQRGRDEQARVVRGQQAGDRDADAQQLFAVDRKFVEKILHDAREGGGVVGQLPIEIKGQRAVAELMQAQIRRDQTQGVFRHAHAQRDARVRDDIQALRPAPAGELRLARVADKALLEELVEVLIERRHAHTAAVGQHLLGAERARIV